MNIKIIKSHITKLTEWKNWSLKFQIIFGISVIQSVITFSLAIYLYQSQKLTLEKQSLVESMGVLDSLIASTASQILVHDFSEIDNLIKAHAKNSHIEFIEIYNLDKQRIGWWKKSSVSNFNEEDEEDYHLESEDEFPENTSVLFRSKDKLMLSSPIIVSGHKLGWITLEKNESYLQQAIQAILLRGMIVSSISFGLGIILSITLANIILNQINELRRKVEKFGQGENTSRVSVLYNNEIGKLAKEFNRMADELSDFQLKLINSAKFSAIGEMASGIAHEINNPLAIIVARVSSLQKKVISGNIDSEKLSEELQKINDTSFRITRIITSLRNISRDSNLEQSDWTNLQEVINESLDLIQEKLNHNGVQLKLNLPKNIEILFSRVQLGQVLINLLSNSLDAIMGTKNPWINISIDINQSILLIKVQDSGLGIPISLQDKIMQPFFTTKDVGKGTGLGLSLNRSIAEKNRAKFYYDKNSLNTQFIVETTHFRVDNSILKAA